MAAGDDVEKLRDSFQVHSLYDVHGTVTMNLAYGKPNAGNERWTRWDAAYRAS